jgi:type III secretory pathway component EscT
LNATPEATAMLMGDLFFILLERYATTHPNPKLTRRAERVLATSRRRVLEKENDGG